MKRILLIASLLLAGPAILAASAWAAPAFAQSGTSVRIVVPAHDIARGDTIAQSDLTYATVDGTALMSGVATRMDMLSGMQTRRLLHAGEAVRGDDVRRPVIVTKGQAVTMMFSAPGVELTAMGRAMSEGGVGDTISVQNPASYRMITATVTAPGTVRALGDLISGPHIAARR
ncbi:MAG TPA: flagellar basal body P-ring formation chaperone FlgA [Rhizomicrobium sp.]|jgi:flagella basal body P-ring formation protein FlgA|nr:flagellar basal body P-ring formation chaperone FlgA [Rhizomicrobium sp.]